MRPNLLNFEAECGVEVPKLQKEALRTDLQLDEIVECMAQGDPWIRQAAAATLLRPLTQSAEILKRQEIVRDCLKHPNEIRGLYQFVTEAIESGQKEGWGVHSCNMSTRFYGAVKQLQNYRLYLERLRKMADSESGKFSSQGVLAFFSEIQACVDDEFLTESKQLLEELEFRHGTLMEMTLDHENRPQGYILVRRNPGKFRLRWEFSPSYALEPRDDAGARDLADRCDCAYSKSVDVLTEAADGITEYFMDLRNETAFFVGAIHLHQTLKCLHAPCCFPILEENGRTRAFEDLKNTALLLQKGQCVGSNLRSRNCSLFLITGTNQGGKTTFLRSIGQAQLMFQSGLFVTAQEYRAPLCGGVWTHFKKGEEVGLNSGKLDEELQRMNAIIPHLHRGALVLFNESFASTNEREGSEIARQITAALQENGIEQFHVTHLYSFAREYFEKHRASDCFLCAERTSDGNRSFRMVEGEPLPSAHGEEVFADVFGTSALKALCE